jgi:hypothetical protein
MESASLDDRKKFVRAFVAGVSFVPGEARLDVRMRTLPANRVAATFTLCLWVGSGGPL